MDFNTPDFTIRFRNGDHDTFHDLYEHYAPLLYGHIKKRTLNDAIAAEVLVCVFVIAFRDFKTFDPGKQRIFTWLYLISEKLLCNESAGNSLAPQGADFKTSQQIIFV